MLLTQSATFTRSFLIVQSADHVTGLTGATVTVAISKAGGAFGAPSGGATATEIANGWYKIPLSATDTNTLGALAFHCTAATLGDPTDFVDQVYDVLAANALKVNGTAQTARDLGASVLLSAGTGTGQLDFTSGVVKCDVRQLLGTAWLTPGVAGTPDVNAKLLGGTSQTGRDIGASVLLSSGTGTGQVTLSAGTVSLTTGQFIIKKNAALAGVTFLMTDLTGSPATGLTVTANESINGGAIVPCTNAVTELSGGLYRIDLAAADLNGVFITFVMTAGGASANAFSFVTQS